MHFDNNCILNSSCTGCLSLPIDVWNCNWGSSSEANINSGIQQHETRVLDFTTSHHISVLIFLVFVVSYYHW